MSVDKPSAVPAPSRREASEAKAASPVAAQPVVVSLDERGEAKGEAGSLAACLAHLSECRKLTPEGEQPSFESSVRWTHLALTATTGYSWAWRRRTPALGTESNPF